MWSFDGSALISRIGPGMLWYIAFLFSTTLHEASHAFAAFRLGDRTAYDRGQLTLNPVALMRREPLGTIVVPLVSFMLGGWMIGWASVVYNRQWAYDNPRSSAVMSVAGPAANLLLALIAAFAIRLGMLAGVFTPSETIDVTHVIDAVGGGFLDVVVSVISVFFSLNLLLCAFNLLPVPPLDGSGIIPLFLSKERAQKYLQLVVHNPSLTFLGIFVAWKIFDIVYDPLHLACINLLFFPDAHYR